MLDQVDAGLNLWDRYRRWKKSKINGDDNVASRFVRLFESHGIGRNQIPRYFDHGLTLADLKDDDALYKVLSPQMLESASKLFAVRPEWLECVDSQVYPVHDFYKQPEKFESFVDSLLGTGSQISGTLFACPANDLSSDAFILLEESYEFSDSLTITRYHLCANWVFNYFKSRAFLIACVSIAWSKDVFIHGSWVKADFIERYVDGEGLIGTCFNEGTFPRGRLWHPEDMALDPLKFIEGLRDGVDGQKLGVEMMIKLRDQGYLMSEDFKSVSRGQSFEACLGQLRRQ